ncbi:MAG TPA: sulfotransferase, partial [Allosphingosinicella sp.]|nr:sulfotransferase [Allosphingosinicella sp.]
FESLLPVPQFGRRLRAQAGLALLRRLNPAIGRIHPTAATAPEEEFGLFSYSLGSAQFEAQWRIPSFSRWWETAPRATMYAEFKRLLKTIDWSRRNSGAGRWVIKAPQFLQDLPAVLDAFPGASLLCLERDPAQVVPSSASLVWNQMRIQSDEADPHWVGHEWLRKTRLRQEMSETTLRVRGVPRLRIDYEAMNADWRSQMRRVYDFLGLELTIDILRRMEGYQSRARAHHGHVYDLGRFGLTEIQLNSAFADGSRPSLRTKRIHGKG